MGPIFPRINKFSFPTSFLLSPDNKWRNKEPEGKPLCTLMVGKCTMCIAMCKCRFHCTLHCTLYIEQCTIGCTAHCFELNIALHIAHNAHVVHIAHCTVCILH